MEHEQIQDNYPPPKTAKMFFSSLQKSIQKRDGNKLYKDLKQLYLTNLYLGIPAKNWDIKLNPTAYAQVTFKIIQNIKGFAEDRAKGNWAQCFQKHMALLIAVLKLLQEMKQYTEWISKGFRVIVRATKSIFLSAQKAVSNSATAAKLKNTLLNTLQRFKSARALLQEIKRQYLPLVDIMQVSILLSFHNYEQIHRILYSPKMYGDVGHLYMDNFLFQKGKYSLVNQNLKQADQCLSKITLKTKGQKRLVLRYLIPCKILLGSMFEPKNQQQKQDYGQYISIIKTIVEADFKTYDYLILKYQKIWLKRGIYLVMDRMRILLWRNLIKKLAVICNNKIEIELIEKAVHLRGGNQSIDECVCIVANLIYQGYLKGYIFQNQTKRALVLKSNGGAFPSLSSIAR